jgi:hypothetical protein
MNESKIIEKRYQLIFVFFWKLANDYHFIIKDRTVVTNPEQLEIIASLNTWNTNDFAIICSF